MNNSATQPQCSPQAIVLAVHLQLASSYVFAYIYIFFSVFKTVQILVTRSYSTSEQKKKKL